MPEENKAPSAPLSESQAVDALMGVEPSTSEDPKRAPEGEEVTEGEAPVKAEEAAVRQSQRPTVDDAVDQLLGPEGQDKADEEADDDPDGDEDADEDDVDDAEDAESDAHSDDEDGEEPDPQSQVLFHTEDGTPVTVDEAKRGYLRQADYTRKTQELAKARQDLQQAFQGRQQERQVLAENLNLALSVVEPRLAELAKTNWDQLASKDPYEYAEKRALFDQAQARYNGLVQQSQQLIQRTEAERAQARQQQLAQEARKLLMAMPDYGDPKQGPQLRAAIAQYARDTVGLTEREAKGITDHRLIVALDKARRFDELQKGSLSVAQKKVQKAPKKPLRPGKPKSQAQRQAKQQEERMARLRRTGSVDDAVALLMG